MSIKSLFSALLIANVLTGCVTTSKPTYVKANGASNGWEVRLQSQSIFDQTDPLSYEVTYKYQSFLTGPGFGVTRETLEVYAFYRCAELALELGKPYFIIKSPPHGILDPKQEFFPEKMDYGRTVYEILHIKHSVAPFKTRQEAERNLKRYQYQFVFDAQEIMARYKPLVL